MRKWLTISRLESAKPTLMETLLRLLLAVIPLWTTRCCERYPRLLRCEWRVPCGIIPQANGLLNLLWHMAGSSLS
jgi:hypothetical protein